MNILLGLVQVILPVILVYLFCLLLFKWERLQKLLKVIKRPIYVTGFAMLFAVMYVAERLGVRIVFRYAVALFLCAAAFLWINFEAEKKGKASRGIILVLQGFLLMLMLNASVGSFGIALVFNLIPVALFLIALYLVGFGRTFVPVYIFTAAAFILAIANSYVMKFRGIPILADDVYSITTAANVASDYRFTLGINNIFIIIAGVFVISSIRKMPRWKKTGWKNAFHALAAVVAFLLFWIGPWYTKVEAFSWNMAVEAKVNGYFSVFVKNMRESMLTRKEGYTLEKVEEIMEEISAEHAVRTKEAAFDDKKKTPNIIAIMNESFCDLQKLGELETEEDYMPYIHSLEGSNVILDYLIVGGKGGGTSITESEFLLSTSKINYAGVLPYVRCIKSETPSLVSVLKNQGYYTVGMHPAANSNYNRSTVYTNLGFDEIHFNDSALFKDAVEINGNISDKSDFEALISLYENRPDNQPFFCFNVTIQNHSPYINEEKISITSMDAEENIERYLADIRETDEAFRMLTEYFADVEEDTLILMFGDHQPPLDSAFWEAMTGKEEEAWTDEDLMKQIQVPYILWANYDMEAENIGTVSPNYLAPWLLETAGLSMSDFQFFVWQNREKFPVINISGCIDEKGRILLPDALEDEEYMKKYSLLTWNYLFDAKNRPAEFFGFFDEKNVDK